MTLKRYKHNPPHLFIPEAKYFITGSIYKKRPLLQTDKSKEVFLSYLFESCNRQGWTLEDWVVLDNHYHIMVDCNSQPKTLPNLINNVHKYSAIWINKNINTVNIRSNKKVWHNYWDTCIDFESSYFARINYIWNNPVKHGYVEESQEWKFGSFYELYRNDQVNIQTILNNYPSDRIKIRDEY